MSTVKVVLQNPIFLKENYFKKNKSIFYPVKLSGISELNHFCHLCIHPFQKMSKFPFSLVKFRQKSH